VAGSEVRSLVRLEPDPAIRRIVETWPGRFDARRARALGLEPDADFESIIRRYALDHPQAAPTLTAAHSSK
jgi:nucleoside-diphosphate-sugar epimerase